MTFPVDFLDAIRARVGLGETIGRRVRLTRRGRELVGLCPFHGEKSPSFTVVEDKGFFHCFGCGAHGDVIGFVMRVENLSFPEAVARLADEAGLPMPAMRPEDAERARRQASLYEVVEQAARWFQRQLGGGSGRDAREYLAKRGVGPETMERFRLGFAPDSRGALKAALIAEGVPEPALIEAGLVVRPDESATYDRMRGRVVFPITDSRGRVVGFGGRILGTGKPKYLNSPETPLFQKGSLLYGLAQARIAARAAERTVVVEGYMDVIALHQAGIENAVAPLGTALSERQLELLWKVAPEVAICLDADAAGFGAAVRVYQRALPLLAPERRLSFVLGAEGKDPDEVVRDRGAAAMRARIDAARPWHDVVWDMHLVELKGTADPDPASFGPQDRARLDADLAAVAARIGHEGLRRHVERHFRDRAWRYFNPRRNKPAGPGLGRGKGPRSEPTPPGLGRGRDGQPDRRERELIRAVLERPELLERIEEDFAHLHPQDARLDELARKILEIAAASPSLDETQLRSHLEKHGCADILDGAFATRGWARSLVRWRELALDDAEKVWRDAYALGQRQAWRRDLEEAVAQCGDAADPGAWDKVRAIAQVGHAADLARPDDDERTANDGER